MADLDFTPGRWAVVPGRFQHTAELLKIESISTTQICGNLKRIARKDVVYATFDDYAQALRLKNTIDGVHGEAVRRQRAATEWADRRVQEILKEYSK